MLQKLLALIAICLCACAAQAAPATAVLAMEQLRQPQGTESLASVAAAPPERFRAVVNGVTGGYSNHPNWLRITLNAPAGEWWLTMLPPFLDDLRLYEPDPDHAGAFFERRSGDHFPFTQREENYRGFVFKLNKAQAEPLVLYLRVQTTSSTRLLARVLSPADFHATMALENGVLMAIIGATLGVLLISLNSWLWLREELSFWSVAYLLSLLLLFAAQDGFVTQYLLPQSPRLGDALVSVMSLATFGVGAAFFRRLFGIEPQQRLLSGIYRCAAWWPLVGFVGLAAGYVNWVMYLQVWMMLALMPLGVWLSWHLWRQQHAAGGMLLFANLLGIAALLSVGTVLMGIVHDEVIAGYVTQIMALGTATVLHLVTGLRLRGMREQALWAQNQMQLERESMRQQTEFFAMLSHELKTPLAMIDGSVQSLQLLTPQHPEVELRHDRIRRAVARINDLLQKFLVHSHLDHSNPPLRRHALLLDALVRETAAGLGASPGRIVLDLEPELELQGDEALLKVMVSNLIDNALKYSPPDSVVSVRLQRADGAALLEVRDQGNGVAPELRKRLFQSYVRGDRVGDIPGAGLGLHLVRKIARLHGGQVRLLPTDADQIAPGAAFRVSLKLDQEQA
ncbi:MAG: sensor histidine kinase [Rhodoferax sp.]